MNVTAAETKTVVVTCGGCGLEYNVDCDPPKKHEPWIEYMVDCPACPKLSRQTLPAGRIQSIRRLDESVDE